MKLFLNCVVFYFIVGTAFSQSTATILTREDKDTNTWMNNSPQTELIKFSNHSQIGSGLIIGGSFMSILGSTMYASRITTYANGATSINTSKESGGMAMMVIGGLTSLVGTYFIIEAPTHVRRAALIMNANGIGVKLKM